MLARDRDESLMSARDRAESQSNVRMLARDRAESRSSVSKG